MKTTESNILKSPARAVDKTVERGAPDSLNALKHSLMMGHLRLEKCELEEAQESFESALEFSLDLSRRTKDVLALRYTMEAISGLLRLAGEAMDTDGLTRWGDELDDLMAKFPNQVPPMANYCKALIQAYRRNPEGAQRTLHQYIRQLRDDTENENLPLAITKGLISLGVLWKNKKPARARFVAQTVLKRFESMNLRGINGLAYLLLGNLDEQQNQLDSAMQWYQKAHSSFLAEHNWYYHLYVLYGYARIHRLQQNYPQAYWFLDLAEKAASGTRFLQLRKELTFERSHLEQDAVDLLIDSRKCLVQTRDSGPVSLRKQYVLLHILEALSKAHGRHGDDHERGLSKAEIIAQVWKEHYRPEAHDNKLYYNINRLRKLIEPDIRKPQYLLTWKEGYRLAPGLKVQLMGGSSPLKENIQ